MTVFDKRFARRAPPATVRRQTAAWGVIQGDNVEGVRHEGFDYRLLSASERAERYDGETLVDGLPKSHAIGSSRIVQRHTLRPPATTAGVAGRVGSDAPNSCDDG